MGVIQHHAIIVTGRYESVLRAHMIAKKIFPVTQLSEICGPTINSTFSFAVFPDGSKEYWSDSDTGDRQRGEFISYLKLADDTMFKETTWGELD